MITRTATIVARMAVFVAAIATLASMARAADERTIEVATRPGQKVRALLIIPDKPRASVILLAGGHGNLMLSGTGHIGWGAGNQLVRTRAAYAQAGYATLVPDIAPDLKRPNGGVDGYRWSAQHAADIGALIAHMRGIAEPVYLIGTSRAALSVANAAVRTKGREQPDAIVITSGLLMHAKEGAPSVETKVPGFAGIRQPTLLVAHKDDGCVMSPAASAPLFKARLKSAERVDVRILTGGSGGSGDPCEAKSPHGFIGIDQVVVRTISDWLAALPQPAKP